MAPDVEREPQADEQVDYLEELSRLNNELVNAQRQLAKKNAELEALSKLKDQFLGMATHDLRRPVSAIIAYAGLLQDAGDGPHSTEQKEFIERILDAATFMSKLVDDFLSVAMIESGRLKLGRDWTDLPTLIGRVLPLAKLQGDAKDVAITAEQDPRIPPLFLDSGKVEQVLANLLGNAVEHSHAGSQVDLLSRLEADRVVVEVVDEGVGIPEDLLATVFDPVKERRTVKTGGELSTGLGLVISRKVVEAHGGRIEAESQVDQGSTFRVFLPLPSDGDPSA